MSGLTRQLRLRQTGGLESQMSASMSRWQRCVHPVRTARVTGPYGGALRTWRDDGVSDGNDTPDSSRRASFACEPAHGQSVACEPAL